MRVAAGRSADDDPGAPAPEAIPGAGRLVDVAPRSRRNPRQTVLEILAAQAAVASARILWARRIAASISFGLGAGVTVGYSSCVIALLLDVELARQLMQCTIWVGDSYWNPT